ncbi:MAG: hypothetical protein AB2L12_15625 [Smithellaceae bacterium]
MRKNPARNSFLIIALFILFTGCGFKGNPVPYPVVPDKKPVIKNMEALSSEEGVVLKWTFQDEKGFIKYIAIEKSEVGTPGNECKNCPRTFTGIGRISVTEGVPADKQQRVLSFTDTKAEKGKIYNYRLMLCTENENCTEAATAEINYK